MKIDQNNVYKCTSEDKEKARERLKRRLQPAFSEEEYYEHIAEQYDRFCDVRRKATEVCQ
ncbi:hypothetical protein [Paenibacillus polymyxa]|uniref:Uncharacterized protein n=1 Tax=Paenibacillus polymyxa (strain SC2) TaxID=886882 RepID=E3EL41_PAEPS|nr:hypothetical protein [Paenibacillus polymyxa]ADO59603.1 hypothetical protein PPSC2_27115 [Paenibacillus polymyxa SC2]WPQ59572.1 hypothetical protein SKN87_28320 [Paenibacillus polymyxa]